MAWLYLSPHLDDAVFSCGGLIWEQARAGEGVQVWTICAGDPPGLALSAFARSLHERWWAGPDKSGPGAVALRREEDRLACQRLGAASRHFPIPDAIYRRDPDSGKPFYNSDEDLFSPLTSAESGLVEELSALLEEQLPPDSWLVCPLALGNHIDHQLVRAAAERLGRPLWYYADLPYVLRAGGLSTDLVGRMEATIFEISEPAMQAWAAAAVAYGSQVSTFWPGVEAMQADLRTYCRKMGGVRLWRPGP